MPRQGETQPGWLTGCCSAPPHPHGVNCSVTLSPCQRQGPWSLPIPFVGKAEQGTALAGPTLLLPATAASSPGQPKPPALCERLQLWGCLLPVLHGGKAEIWQRGQPASASMQGRATQRQTKVGGKSQGAPSTLPQSVLSPPWSCPPAAGPRLQPAGAWVRVGALRRQREHPRPALSADFNCSDSPGLTRASRQCRAAAV